MRLLISCIVTGYLLIGTGALPMLNIVVQAPEQLVRLLNQAK